MTLAVTSSTSVVGVAIGPAGADDQAAVVADQIETDRRHAEELTPMIGAVLRRAGVSIGDLELLAVDVGPGRFTGLRVGLATVKTLALALGVPVVGLTSLEILAAAEVERPLVAVIDARRSEVFQQRFDPAGGPAVVGPPEELASDVEGAAAVVGDGADRYAELYGAEVRPGRVPSAAVMIRLATQRPSGPGAAIEPRYLRDPDVNVNVKTRYTAR